jgi:hypothetical protein
MSRLLACCFGSDQESVDVEEELPVTPPIKQSKTKAGRFLYDETNENITGINNSASKYAEHKPVHVSSENWEERLERAIRLEEEARRGKAEQTHHRDQLP